MANNVAKVPSISRGTLEQILVVAAVEDGRFLNEQLDKYYPGIKRFIFTDPSPKQTLDDRRKRIAMLQNVLKDAVRNYPQPLIWQLEQDSVIDQHTLQKLVDNWLWARSRNLKTAYVSGLQVGRHGAKCIGAWHIQPELIKSLDFREVRSAWPNQIEVDATGLYCLFGMKDIWMQGEASWNNEPYGPDVVWGLSLKQRGYSIYACTDTFVGHKLKRTILQPNDEDVINVAFEYKGGKWKFRQYL